MRYLIFSLIAVLLSPFSSANNLVLEIAGQSTKIVTFDALRSVPSTTYNTHLPWIKGKSSFTGVSLMSFLNTEFGHVPDIVTFHALNDYSVDILKSDIEKYSPIIAYLKDNKAMTVREKGPYWIIYSLSKYPNLDNSHYHAQMIWQLEKIQIDER